MPAKYDFYETPKQKGSKKHTRYHARIVGSETIKTEDLSKRISGSCSLTTSDIIATLDALVREMVTEMKRGNRIHLEGLGFFKLTLSCPPVKSTHQIRAESIHFKSVAFRPEIGLKKKFNYLELERIEDKRHSRKHEDEEVERRLTNYFQNNPHITSLQFRRLLGLTQSTAYRKLDLLVKEGKLRKGGYPRQILYAPLEGYYGR